MKSNRPLQSNMSWRAHKCFRTCWANMQGFFFPFLPRLLSHILTLIVLNLEHMFPWTACHLGTSEGTKQSSRQSGYEPLWTPLSSCWCVPACPPHPCFLMMNCLCTNKLPVQPFPLQLSGNITKKSSLSGLHADCHPPPTAVNLFIFFLLDTLLHPPALIIHRQQAWDIQRWMERKGPAHRQRTCVQNGVSTAFAGLWDS